MNHIWPGWTTQTDDFITDLYYSDIYDENGNFCSWDSNNDNIFSEFYLYNLGENPGERFTVDDVDLYPDIGVGRIPCENKDELDIVITKIINYETQNNNDWFNHIILAGSDGFPEPGYQFEMVTEQVAEEMTEFTQMKLYESLGNLNTNSINSEINNGAGFFISSSHGSPGSFHNYLKSDIKGLQNGNKLPIMFLIGCYCAQLDSSLIYNLQIFLLSLSLQIANNPSGNNNALELINHLKQILNNVHAKKLQTCIAWELLKYEQGGSVATIGGTRSGTLQRSDPTGGFQGLFCVKFFESYEPGISLSHMYNNAITSFIHESWKNHVTIQRFILLGDPSLKLGGYS